MTVAPTVAPPAGFEARVLDHIAAERPTRRRPRRTVLLVAAAAAVLGIALGAVGARTLVDRPALSASSQGAALRTSSGSEVGTVEPSAVGGDPVIVLQVTSGQPGTHYTCRMVLADGSTRDGGDWWMPSSGRSTWIAHGSRDSVDRVELVTDDGTVWSSAELS
jgi:hypothetical protein